MSTLPDYVVSRLRAGRPGAEVCAELRAVGWSKEVAEAAYRDGLVALGIPLPDGGDASGSSPAAPKGTTGEVVVNLFSFILLGIVAGAWIALCFALINQAFPDADELRGDYLRIVNASTIHYSIASMAIAFPLYLLALAWWLRHFSDTHERSESRLTKWLTYLVLLAASVTIVCDLIALVYALLQGETTTRFLLKVIVVLGVAAMVLGFYLFERRSVQFAKAVPAGVFKGFGWGAATLVLAAALAGYLSAGSPQVARKLAADSARSQDLIALSRCIERYAGAMSTLPDSLQELERTSSYADCPTYDRETRQRFGYRIVTGRRAQGTATVGDFELCTEFALVSATQHRPVPGGAENWFDHPAGRSCRTTAVQLTAGTSE